MPPARQVIDQISTALLLCASLNVYMLFRVCLSYYCVRDFNI